MSKDLLSGPTNKMLLAMSLPIGFGMLSTILFQVIDTYFIGQLGAGPLAALGFASTVYFLLIGLFIGLSVGVSIIIGEAFGAGDPAKVKRVTSLSLVLSFSLVTLISWGGVISVEQVFGWLGADVTLLGYISEYIVPMYWGMPILAVGIVSGGILRATGNIKLPEMTFAVAGIINAFFDYVFIFGKWGFPELGIKGVAYGTVISWIFIILVMLVLLFRDKLLILSFLSGRQKNLDILGKIWSMGVPSILTQMVSPLTLTYLIYLLGKFSPNAVAAYGVAGRIETLALIGIMAVSTAITPFIAQNLGAKKHDRIDEAVVFGGKAATYLGFLLMILLFVFISPIASLFSNNAEVTAHTRFYFYLVGGSYIFYSFYLITTALFNGLQLPKLSLKIMAIKTFILTVPFTLIGSYFGVKGLFIGLAISNVLGGIYAMWTLQRQLKKVERPLALKNPLIGYRTDMKAISHFFFSSNKTKA